MSMSMEIGAHTYEWLIDKEATTTSTGLKHLECKVCKKALPSEVISKVSENTTTKTKKKSTNAGNLTHLTMWLSLFVVSGMGIVAILFKKIR